MSRIRQPPTSVTRVGARLGFLAALLVLWQILTVTHAIPSDALASRRR